MLMCLKTVQKYKSHVCQSPPCSLEAFHFHPHQSLPTSHRASCLLSPPKSWSQPWLTSKAYFLKCLILKTSETKNKTWGKEWGCSLKTKSVSNNHLCSLVPLLCCARAGWVWLGTGNDGKCLAGAGWYCCLAKEFRLHQIVLVLFNLRELPSHLCQHVTQGIELLIFDVFALWVQGCEN